MSLNSTPISDRLCIGIFGKRNAGKSSLINALTGQNLAIVSEVAGTTTDPVQKAMELLPLGPVVIIDTPGLDDEGDLGLQRVEKAYQALRKCDIALLVIDGTAGISIDDKKILSQIKQKALPYLIVINKSDLAEGELQPVKGEELFSISVSALNGKNITELKERITALVKEPEPKLPIIADLLTEGDLVILVTPIDASAPKGRLILPQQQTIREILDAHAFCLVVQDSELATALRTARQKPRIVVTDSQAFKNVAAVTPDEIPLTSFSILFARHKGSLKTLLMGIDALDKLKDGDRLLIAEGCTHHRQCEDIGTVKLPAWITKYTGKNLNFIFCSGTEFPSDLSSYNLVIHCGGCMLNEKEMQYRMSQSAAQSIPITNYGMVIAKINGILQRSLQF
ncbi:MAG: [FeFe] hydrogenase H-cluster maturation GTPase HydF [Clostridia bacterium]|nr:[FeFe] hydrogenase H-cluster maturation GTPase HydF [Clostridia bacterium]MDD4798290.1 [FeFe] hydrogenase H-cluster maturation GTPase HydF [Clostridia bacterium]